jgi:hypothetical protein
MNEDGPVAGTGTGWADEAGFVGGLEALPFGVLVFVVGVAMLVNAWGVIDATLAASAAARRAATDAIDGHKADPGRWDLRTEGGADLRRCARVTFVVTYDVPTFRLPWVGSFGGRVITATGRHSEVVDPYRQGLSVAAPPAGACRG